MKSFLFIRHVFRVPLRTQKLFIRGNSCLGCRSSSRLFSEHIFYNRTIVCSLLSNSSSLEHTYGNISSCSATLDNLFLTAQIRFSIYGWIPHEDVKTLIDETKRLGNNISYAQSLFLIRCLGSGLPEVSPLIKKDMLNEVLEILNSHNMNLDIGHHNNILAVYLENEICFDPHQYIQMLDNSRVTPNKVTFQRLIAYLCIRGHMEKVAYFLDQMRRKDFIIDIDILNSIVKGFSLIGDWENAENTIETIRSSGLEPDSHTYCALLSGYAKQGCIDSISSIIDFCKSQHIALRDKDILNTFYVAAVNGHSHLFDFLLQSASKNWGYNRECVNLVLRLVANRHEEPAFKVVLSMKPIISNQGSVLPSGNFFIRHLVKSGCSPEKIEKFCEHLIASGKNRKAFFTALEAATIYNNSAVVSSMMWKLQRSKNSIKSHLFEPLLTSRARLRGEDGVLSLLLEMKSLGATASSETIIRFVLPHLTGDVKTVLKKLLDSRISFYVSVVSVLQYSIQCHDFTSAVWIASNYYTALDVKLRRALVQAYLESRDAVSVGKLIRALLPQPKDIDENHDLQDFSHHLIESILKEVCDQTTPSELYRVMFPLLETILAQRFSISVSTSNYLRQTLKDHMNEPMEQLLHDLESIDFTLPDSSSLLCNRQNVGSEAAVRNVKEFNHYARLRDLQAVLKCKKMLDEKHVPLTDGMTVSLMMTYADNGDFDQALAILTNLVQTGSKVSPSSIFSLSLLLLRENRIEDAFYVLNSLSGITETSIMKDCTKIGALKVLNRVALQGDVELTRRLFEFFKEKTSVNRNLLSPLIKVLITRKDLNEAVNEFTRCIEEYHCAPCKVPLLEKLIEIEDSASIKTVLELSNKIDGEKNTLFDLAFAYVRCERLKKAQEIFETPGLRALNKRLDDVFRYYSATHRIREMEDLMKITKTLFNVDRFMLFDHMLTALINADEPLKSLELWEQLMQEKEVTPTEEFMLRLGNFLRSKNYTVPFTMPNITKNTIADGSLNDGLR